VNKLLASLFACVVCVAGAANAAPVERVVSPGGIEAWLIEDHSLPVISLQLAFCGGAAADPVGQEGRSRMALGLLDEGAGDLDSEAFKAKLESVSGSVSFSDGSDASYGSLRTLTKHRDDVFDLLRLALTQPRFDATAVERIRQQIQISLSRGSDDPTTMARWVWHSAAFPGHPYGRTHAENVDAVAKLTADQLKEFVASRLARDVLIVGVSGDITKDDLAVLLDRTFGALPATAQTVDIPKVAPADAGQTVIIQREIPQSVMVFGEAGITRDDPDFYAAYILNYVLGGGSFSSVLMDEVREKRGLVYGIGTGLSEQRYSPLLLGQTATRNDKVGTAYDLIRTVWGDLGSKGMTQKQLDEAKTFLTGSFALQLNSTTELARFLVQMQVDHLGQDYIAKRNSYIQAVSLAQINRVAKRLLLPENLSFVVVGNPQGIKATLPVPAGY
jgi:zinc protease